VGEAERAHIRAMATAAPPGTETQRDRWLLPVLERVLGADSCRRIASDAATHEATIWEVAVGGGWISGEALLASAAGQLGMEVADLSAVNPDAIALIGERWARQFRVLPLGAGPGWLQVATADPHDLDCERTLAFATGRAIRFALAPPEPLSRRIDEAYRGVLAIDARDVASPPTSVEHITTDMEIAPAMGIEDEADGNVVRILDRLLAEAVKARASDLHVEPEEQGIVVRHRLDGVLRNVRVLPRSVAPALASRVKIISGLDIADRLRPQDGRARVAVNGHPVDLRVSTLPASHGEKIVIRILDARASIPSLDAMGFLEDELARVRQLLSSREGIILVTGPTGSGKTTTLYAALAEIKAQGVNIVTVEDPIEYRIPGIVQVQVHERAGLTFGAALRSIMRQDPDVILVGEIRDRETAEIAIQASLTGHLVLSTLHTNDAASAVARLMDIGVAPHKIATAVKGVLAQRLVRRRCPNCAAGCEECSGTGFRGRLPILESLIITSELERCIAASEPTERLVALARERGMRSLWERGVEHVSRGETTIPELLRVARPPADPAHPRKVAEPPPAVPAVPENSTVSPKPPVHATPRVPAVSPMHATSPVPAVSARSALSAVSQSSGPSCPNYISPAASVTTPPEFASDMTEIRAGTIDVYVIRPLPDGWKVLVMQRSLETRCPTAWETVHGRLEEGERPEDGATRELEEETGLRPSDLWVITVQPYYLRASSVVQLAVVFAAFVEEPASVTLGPEHSAYEWLPVEEAARRFAWPREREALREIQFLLRSGSAGAVDDVLRVK
jgi:type II secretory ATPase GspE/PulE/Tfp pilus assembly ATPase PilB-like protein/8-oxo-dGTP pyrophosphatase MutT (NUDIX family)